MQAVQAEQKQAVHSATDLLAKLGTEAISMIHLQRKLVGGSRTRHQRDTGQHTLSKVSLDRPVLQSTAISGEIS